MNKEGKIATIVLWVLVIISAVLVVSLMANVGEDYKTDPVLAGWVYTNLTWSYILLAIGAGIVIISGLYHMITDIKAAKGGLVALVFFAVIFGVSYALSSDAIPQFVGVQEFVDSGALTANISKLIDTGLYASYILLGLSILSIVYSSVARLFK